MQFTALQAIGMSTIQLNAGFLNTTTISSVNVNISSSLLVSSILTSGLRVGTSCNTQIFFAGLSNDYSRTVIVEQSNSATSQELLLYKGGISTDQIRAQTTGSISFEAGVSARQWPINTTAGANPSLFINGIPGVGLNTIGINTNNPQATLDVTSLQGGTAQIRSPQISTNQIFTSSLVASFASVFYNTIISTVQTGRIMLFNTIPSGSYVFISSSNETGATVNLSLPTISVLPGTHYYIKHKGSLPTNTCNFNISVNNTATLLNISTTMKAIYTGVEWMSAGVFGSN